MRTIAPNEVANPEQIHVAAGLALIREDLYVAATKYITPRIELLSDHTSWNAKSLRQWEFERWGCDGKAILRQRQVEVTIRYPYLRAMELAERPVIEVDQIGVDDR